MDDIDLIKAAQAGDDKAFEALWLRYEPMVRGYIRVRVRSDDAIKEILQRTRIEFRKGLAKFDVTKSTKVGSWIIRIANWRLLDYYREQGRREQLNPNFAAPPAPDSGPDELANDAKGYEEMIHLAFGSGRPPHKTITFGIVKLLDVKPERVHETLAAKPLRYMFELMVRAYARQSAISKTKIATYFQPLQDQLKLEVGRLLASTPKKLVGDCSLKDFFESQDADEQKGEITQWWDSEKRFLIGKISRGRGTLAIIYHKSPAFHNSRMKDVLQEEVVPHIRNARFEGKLPKYFRPDDWKLDLLAFDFDRILGGVALIMAVGDMRRRSSAGDDKELSKKPCEKPAGGARAIPDYALMDKSRIPADFAEWFRYGRRSALVSEEAYRQVAGQILAAFEEALKWWRIYG